MNLPLRKKNKQLISWRLANGRYLPCLWFYPSATTSKVYMALAHISTLWTFSWIFSVSWKTLTESCNRRRRHQNNYTLKSRQSKRTPTKLDKSIDSAFYTVLGSTQTWTLNTVNELYLHFISRIVSLHLLAISLKAFKL